ncbi:MAG: DMT family transporter [Gammaproteobacteria bacterium]|nr:DMT family transporter [Gammaproteobacteria bacterium]
MTESPGLALDVMPDSALQGPRLSGIFLVLISALVFSSAGLFVKGVESDAWAILFWRGLSAAIFTTAYVAWRGVLQREFARMGKPGIMAGVVGALATIAFIPSFKYTSIANVSLIYAAVPFAAATISWIWMREKPTAAVLVASLVAFVGVVVIVGGSLDSLNLRGDLLALWMTLGMAAYLCIYRRYPGTPAAGPAVLLSLLLVPVACVAGDPLSAPPGEIFVMCSFGLVFAVASVTMAEGARRLPAAETALISALETPLAPLWAFLLLAEMPPRYTLAGGSIILIAVFASQLYGWSKKPQGV